MNVADLLRMATFMHRDNMGDIFWFGWCSEASGAAPTWPCQASHGLMVTKSGASAIALAMEAGVVERGHIDLKLMQWLRKEGVATAAKAGYITPSVGAFYAHPSECDPKHFGKDKGGRPHGWGRKSSCTGTRVAEDSKRREKWAVQWLGTGKGNRERTWIAMPKDDVLHSEDYRWLSFKEDEPTAASTTTAPPSTPPPPLTQRAKRVQRQWTQRMQMRTFVSSQEEAALPSILFSPQSNHGITSGRLGGRPVGWAAGRPTGRPAAQPVGRPAA